MGILEHSKGKYIPMKEKLATYEGVTPRAGGTQSRFGRKAAGRRDALAHHAM